MTPNSIRIAILEAVHLAGKGHLGGALSCVDILHVLYSIVLHHNPEFHTWELRDRFLLSKGHVGVALYATLSAAGYFAESELHALNREGRLGEHPSRNVPGVEMDSGSLGQGLGVGCGMALAAKLKHEPWRVYVLMGDGECQEGSVWEAAMFASQHQLDITCIVDRNGLAVHGSVDASLEPLAAKWEAFGWDVYEVDGHDESTLIAALSDGGRPRCVIANTVKGKGVSFMEGRAEWHHGSLSTEQLEAAKKELS